MEQILSLAGNWRYKTDEQDVGIPQDLKAIVKDEDVRFLSESAMADACRPGNPRDPKLEDIEALYRSLM